MLKHAVLSCPSQEGKMNKNVTIAVVALVVIVIAACAIAVSYDSSNDNSNNSDDSNDSSTETTALYDAGVGTVMRYSLSGSYQNYLMQPASISGSYTMTITSATDTTQVAQRIGSYTISGLGQTVDLGQTMTYLRSDLQQSSTNTTTISTNFGQKEVYVITETSHSGPGNIYTTTNTTYRGVDDGISYRQTIETTSTGNYETLRVTANLSSYDIVPYEYGVEE